MGSANPVERFAAALLIPGVLAERLRQLRDPQVGQLLEDEVWPRLNLLAPESTVCLEAAERLRRSVNTLPERKLSRRLGATATRRRAIRPWKAARDEGVHLLNADAALYRGGIPYLLLPFQKNRFASNLLMVRCMAEAKACLCRAGFREKPRSPTVLVDSQTGHPIRLVEGERQLTEANGWQP